MTYTAIGGAKKTTPEITFKTRCYVHIPSNLQNTYEIKFNDPDLPRVEFADSTNPLACQIKSVIMTDNGLYTPNTPYSLVKSGKYCLERDSKYIRKIDG